MKHLSKLFPVSTGKSGKDFNRNNVIKVASALNPDFLLTLMRPFSKCRSTPCAICFNFVS